ncbi:ORF6N domain-containing protein [Lysinibacillus sp. LZ02]|uniref:ORF6N domain-containing protein n=1 Tax=Lysinibacillus sp. LZ02 TaxID=3420668 RepID=UPI003D359CC7
MMWEGQKVCLSRELAVMLGVKKGHLLRNFSRNRVRFEEGIHFYVVTGEAVKVTAPSLIVCLLWTEQGAYQLMQTFRAPYVKQHYITNVFPYFQEGEARC